MNTNHTITVPAFNLSTKEVSYYLTAMNASELFEFSKVSKADEEHEKGYQRLLNEKRVKDISEYIQAGNVIPGAVILSAQKNAKLTFNEETNELTITKIPDSFFVIDGQHRLYGIAMAGELEEEISTVIPVCILNNLTFQQEIQYFLDINSNQKGVPKTLRIELMKFLSENEESIDSLRSQLFDELNKNTDSPLCGRMNKYNSTPNTLSLVPFQAAIDPLLKNGFLAKFDNYEAKFKIILNYLKAFQEWLIEREKSDMRIINATFFKVMFKIFEKVCSLSLMYYRNYKQDSLRLILDELPFVDFEKYSGSNDKTVNTMANEFEELLNIVDMKLNIPDELI